MKSLKDSQLIRLLARKNLDQLDREELEAVSKLTLSVESNVTQVAAKLDALALTEDEHLDTVEVSCQLQNMAETLRLAITQLTLSKEAQELLSK